MALQIAEPRVTARLAHAVPKSSKVDCSRLQVLAPLKKGDSSRLYSTTVADQDFGSRLESLFFDFGFPYIL